MCGFSVSTPSGSYSEACPTASELAQLLAPMAAGLFIPLHLKHLPSGSHVATCYRDGHARLDNAQDH